jgi:hypothetical protein
MLSSESTRSHILPNFNSELTVRSDGLKDLAARIVREVCRQPGAVVRPEWADVHIWAGENAHLVDALRDELQQAAGSLAALPEPRSPAQLRVEVWKSGKLERLCSEVLTELQRELEELKTFGAGEGRRVAETAPAVTQNLSRVILSLQELKRIYTSKRALLAEQISATPAVRRKMRRTCRMATVHHLVAVFERFWEAQDSAPGAVPGSLTRFVQLALSGLTGRVESRRVVAAEINALRAVTGLRPAPLAPADHNSLLCKDALAASPAALSLSSCSRRRRAAAVDLDLTVQWAHRDRSA